MIAATDFSVIQKTKKDTVNYQVTVACAFPASHKSRVNIFSQTVPQQLIWLSHSLYNSIKYIL
jgi:hypothetical protein